MQKYKKLVEEYRRKKRAIKRRLGEFKKIGRKKAEIFPELCFCLLTPQSNARHCDKAIQELKRQGLILKGNARAIRRVLKGKARFHNKKAAYIVGARSAFGGVMLNADDALGTREILVKKVKGLGYKEASHFLRNIGRGQQIAILDRHILKNLKRYGAIETVPASLTPGSYLNIEASARAFAKRVKIPLEELDLLFWSNETGEIFK